MSAYFYVYIISLLVSFLSGWMVWKYQKNISGFFFFLFSILLSIWFIIYFIFFAGFFEKEYLLILSRMGFGIGVLTVYSLLFFIIFFGRVSSKIFTKHVISIIMFFILILSFYVFTGYIILDLKYDNVDNVFREINGSLFFIHLTFHLTFLVLFIYFSFRTLKNLNALDRIRLKNILFSAFLLLFSLIILQLILPYFGIWILEKEIIFLFTAFVVYVPLTIRRYYFTHFGYGFGKMLGHITAFLGAIVVNFGLRYIAARLQDTASGISYWFGSYETGLVDIVVIIGLYYGLHYLIKKFFLGNDEAFSMHLQLQKLKKSISLINNLKELNRVLHNEMQKIFTAQESRIYLYSRKDISIYKDIKKFFNTDKREKIFVNDIVFLQKYSDIFQDLDISMLSTKDIFLAYPIYNTGNTHIGLFILGTKRFGDFFTLQEISILEEFTFFIEIHLKYMRTYDDLQDLTLNLDKKVDEKTIDYNNLINRQKEFIAMISHEVRSPMSAAIFQGESLVQDLEKSDFSPGKLKENVQMLTAQLVRMGGIISKLFSVQYYDNNSVNLFLERIQFAKFLEYEIDLFSHVNSDITVIVDIDTDIGFIKMDKIQFQQVLNNLLDNARKFAPAEDAIIRVIAHLKENGVELTIEDNGKGFEGIDIKKIFDIYTTGTSKNKGLGMGLYLCKKIISMHGGAIKPSVSKQYGGACFTIFLPLGKK